MISWKMENLTLLKVLPVDDRNTNDAILNDKRVQIDRAVLNGLSNDLNAFAVCQMVKFIGRMAGFFSTSGQIFFFKSLFFAYLTLSVFDCFYKTNFKIGFTV